MTRGVRLRLLAFVVLSAVGLTYVTANYLGFVDKVTGRDITISASLPGSGGLFEGSAVTYRGVKIGKVRTINRSAEGVVVFDRRGLEECGAGLDGARGAGAERCRPSTGRRRASKKPPAG